MANFRPIDRATPFLLPPSVEDWLPKDHLARFVVDIVDQLDLSALTRQYRGTGSAAYHPAVMLGLLIYGYATGVYSSRRIEAATHESIAFRYIAANEQPDHDSLCTFRKRFLKEIEALFVQVLCIARQMKLLKLGTIALDGTKVHANASRHSALSYGHAQKIEAQLEAEVKEMLARAEAADQEPLPEGLSIPEELARREERLAAIRQAKAQIEARAAERDAQEKADFDAKMKAREEKTTRTGKKPGGKPPTARPVPACAQPTRSTSPMPIRASCPPRARASSRATTRRPRSIPRACWSWRPAWRRWPPTSSRSSRCSKCLPACPRHWAAWSICWPTTGTSARRTSSVAWRRRSNRCLPRGAMDITRTGRTDSPSRLPLAEPASAVERMKHRLKTRKGRKLYGLRKQTVEPVFGIIKSVMRFRQFLLRGLAAVRGEWSLVTMAWNIKRMAVLAG